MRILHVDDSEMDSELITLVLQRLDSKVDICWRNSAISAFDTLEKESFDCILSDYQMPKMNGLEFLIELKKRNVDVPFIMLTGQGNEEIAVQAFLAGAEDYFTKERQFAHYTRLINRIKRLISEREHRESTLSKLEISEQKFSKAFLVSPVSMAITSLKDGIIIDTNKSFERDFGFTKDEAIGSTSAELGLQSEEQRESFLTALRNGKAILNAETEFFSKSGERLTILLSCDLIPINGEGYFLVVMLNITERRRAERRLLRELAFVDRLMETIVDTVLVIDPIKCKVIRHNSSFKKISGYSDKEISVMKVPEDFFYPDDLEAVSEARKDLEEKGAITYELPLKTKSGDTVPFEYSENLIKVSNFNRVISIGRNKTERKDAEKSLEENTIRFEELYNNTPALLHSINSEGTLVSVSNKWLKAFGYRRDEVLGRNVIEFMTPKSREYAEGEILPEFFRTGSIKKIAYDWIKKDGQIVNVLLSATAEKNSDGRIIRSLAVLTCPDHDNI